MIRSERETLRLEDADTAELAPDFALVDTRGRLVRLTEYRGKRHVVLVFNRGLR